MESNLFSDHKVSTLVRIGLICLVLFFLFFRLGTPPIYEYDEARGGINAIEMLENGHWRGLWFANAPDTVRNKPPLFIWVVAGSFHLFGYNTFGLRFPSALATLGSLIFIFLICRRFYDEKFAWLTILVLLSVKGFAGNHTGRTGDFDALLIFFLMSSTYFFLKYFSEKKEKDLSLFSLLLAGAFMTKGPAMAVLLPGQLIYLWVTKKWKILNGKIVVRQFLLFLIFPAIWLLLINDDQAFTRLFAVDIAERFSNPNFETPQAPSRFTFLFVVLDAYFNVWNYILFLLLGFVLLFPKRLNFQWDWEENPLLIYAFAVWLTLGIGLSLVATTHRWYFSPALPFVAISLVFLVRKIAWRKWIWGVFAAILIFTLGRRALEISISDRQAPVFIQQSDPILKNAETVYWVGSIPAQRDLLYVYFAKPGLICLSSFKDLPALETGEVVVTPRYLLNEKLIAENEWEVLFKDESYWVLSLLER